MTEPYSIIVSDQNGNMSNITGSEDWVVIGMSGIADFNVDITQTKIGGIGSKCNGTNISARNIVLTILLCGNAAASRRKLYKYFTTEKEMTLFITAQSDVVIRKSINFYLEKFECDINENPQTAQISLICPNPWFEGSSGKVLNLSTDNPKGEFQNNGELETGFKSILIKATGGSVVNPIIKNTTTGQTMQINITLAPGESLHICTVRGSRYIKKGSSINGTNVIGSLDASSNWITVKPGTNVISQTASTGIEYMTTRLLLTPCYMGV